VRYSPAGLQQNVSIQQKAILWVDGHRSHEASQALEELAHANIMLIELVAHSSHILQPLDCSFFSSMKRSLRRVYCSIKLHEGAEDEPVPAGLHREWVLRAARSAIQHAATTESIRNCFRAAGIFPLNREVHLGHESVLDPSPTVIAAPSRRHSGVKLGERVMTDPHVVAAIRSREEKKKPKQRYQRMHVQQCGHHSACDSDGEAEAAPGRTPLLSKGMDMSSVVSSKPDSCSVNGGEDDDSEAYHKHKSVRHHNSRPQHAVTMQRSSSAEPYLSSESEILATVSKSQNARRQSASMKRFRFSEFQKK